MFPKLTRVVKQASMSNRPVEPFTSTRGTLLTRSNNQDTAPTTHKSQRRRRSDDEEEGRPTKFKKPSSRCDCCSCPGEFCSAHPSVEVPRGPVARRSGQIVRAVVETVRFAPDSGESLYGLTAGKLSIPVWIMSVNAATGYVQPASGPVQSANRSGQPANARLQPPNPTIPFAPAPIQYSITHFQRREMRYISTLGYLDMTNDEKTAYLKMTGLLSRM
jgi:hypothetical protein